MNVYFLDGTFNNFYSAVFDAYSDKQAFLTSELNYQMALNDKEIIQATDKEKAKRVKNKLNEYDNNALRDIERMLRSDGKDKENYAFYYAKKLCKQKRSVREEFADEGIFEGMAMVRKVGWEIDKFYGLLRFMQNNNQIFYAPYEPDCDITELIVGHFIARFKNEKFIIHDVKRKKAALYNGKDCVFTKMDKADVYISNDESAFTALWKEYYDSVNISQRPHEKQMKGYMPVRYWKYLPEKQ